MIIGKQGGERVLSIYWFIILGIILVGIVSGVLNVFGSSFDVRTAEAGLLKEKVVDCLVSGGRLNAEIYESEDLLSECAIDLDDKTSTYKDESQQYAIKIGDKEFGNQQLFVQCGLSEDFAKCLDTTIYVLNGDEEMFLEIKTAVGKEEQNVRE